MVYNTTMPNVRKKGKKFVGAWITTKLYGDLQNAAKMRGESASDVISSLLSEYTAPTPTILHDKPISSTSAAETDEKVLAVIKTGVKYPRLKRRKKTA